MKATTRTIVLLAVTVGGVAGFAHASTQLDLSTRTVLQSSVLHNGLPRRAVDGNTSALWSSGSCTHTALENYPYFSVDLGGVRTWQARPRMH